MADWTDWTVYSNFAYPVAAIPRWGEWLSFSAMLIAGFGLALSSAWYHATYKRVAQRADVTMVMVYLATGLAVYLEPWTAWGYLLVPGSAAYYWAYTWSIDSHRHAPAWIVASLVVLSIQVGTWSLGAWALALLAGFAKLVSTDSDSWAHDLWHVFGGAGQTWGTTII